MAFRKVQLFYVSCILEISNPKPLKMEFHMSCANIAVVCEGLKMGERDLQRKGNSEVVRVQT